MDMWALRRCRSILTLLMYRRRVDDDLHKQILDLLEYLDDTITPISDETP